MASRGMVKPALYGSQLVDLEVLKKEFEEHTMFPKSLV